METVLISVAIRESCMGTLITIVSMRDSHTNTLDPQLAASAISDARAYREATSVAYLKLLARTCARLRLLRRGHHQRGRTRVDTVQRLSCHVAEGRFAPIARSNLAQFVRCILRL